MNRKTNKLLALLLVVFMMISSMPMMSFAGIICDTIGHFYEWEIVISPTCTQTGVKREQCTRCDATGKTEVIDLLPHSEKVIPAVTPTCDTDGHTEGVDCSMCGLSIVPCMKIEKTGHRVATFDAVPATCEQDGRTAGTWCDICGAYLTGCQVIKATGHIDKDSDNICDNCSCEFGQCGPTAEYIIYGGELYISGTGEIYEDYFANRSDISSVTIREGITIVGVAAFENCSNLCKIHLPNSIEYIYKYAFQNCANLYYVQLGNLPLGNKLEYIGFRAFYGCDKLLTEKLNGTNVFYSCSKDEWLKVIIEADNECLTKASISYGKTDDTQCDGSHDIMIIPATEPTCDLPGNTEGAVCVRCGTVFAACETIEATGHTAVYFKAVPATCITNGYTEGTECSVCGIILSGGKVIEALGHDNKLVSFTAGSCLTGAKEISVYKCKACDEEKVTEVDPVHFFSAWVVTMTATCQSLGKRTRTCRDCGYIEEAVIDKLPHTEYIVAAKDATCIETGITGGKKCKVCDVVLEGCVVIPARGHIEVIINGTPATCDKKGITDGSYCSVCKAVLKDPKDLAALGHIMVADSSSSKIPTCTASGVNAEKCSRAGCNYKTEVLIPPTHNFSSCTINPATCTKDGSKVGYCLTCKQTAIEVIPAAGHIVKNNDLWVTNILPTCTKDGAKVAPCSVCNVEVTEIIPAIGHNVVVYKAGVPATCYSEGLTDSTWCTVCNAIIAESMTIPKTEHKYGEWAITKTATCAWQGKEEATCMICKERVVRAIDKLPHTEKYIPEVAATCTKVGSTAGIECSVCGAIIKAVYSVPAMGHDYVLIEDSSNKATCSEPGYVIYECKICAKTDVKIYTVDHIVKDFDSKEATCTENGYTAGTGCTVCNATLSGGIVMLAKGHDLKLTTQIDPTTAKNGKKVYTCEVCGYSEETILPAIGSVVTGFRMSACTTTSYTITWDEMENVDGYMLAAYDEKEQEWRVVRIDSQLDTTKTSYTVTGLTNGGYSLYKVRYVHYEGEKKIYSNWSEVILAGTLPKAPQNVYGWNLCYTNYLTWDVQAGVSGYEVYYRDAGSGYWESLGTTTNNGFSHIADSSDVHEYKIRAYIGNETNKVYGNFCNVISFHIDSFGHDFDEAYKAPTCIEDGYVNGKCMRCGAVKNEVIPAKGHTFQERWQTIIVPTCSQTGTAIRICKECFDIETKILTTIDHADTNADGKCDMCFATVKAEAECGCNCHKSGITKFFFDFVLFFQKIFGKNKVCACGAAHY